MTKRGSYGNRPLFMYSLYQYPTLTYTFICILILHLATDNVVTQLNWALPVVKISLSTNNYSVILII